MADVWLQDGAHDRAESSDPFPGEAASFLELHSKPLLIRHGRGPFPAPQACFGGCFCFGGPRHTWTGDQTVPEQVRVNASVVTRRRFGRGSHRRTSLNRSLSQGG